MKTYKLQRRVASDLLKTGKNKVTFKSDKLKEIGEAITRNDIKDLIAKKSITADKDKGVSRVRAKKHHAQRLKGRRRGHGTWKGKKTSRTPKKEAWMNKIRPQRDLLKLLREKKKITPHAYRKLYSLTKAGLFRSRSHLIMHIKKMESK